ncbi:YaiO family outer membrane beta-barrel protein [Flavobacterium amniphilum]|uniref:YaiO family outer membrane beta-barrel protein n=1 Tax=Flavobacterium amniphilum TaxID=1834035 RepID=UPI00202AAF5F|nr:YaiO family outer membrane beta-barrel protein [Flavobacterium amniphilum]MCL9805285.1 YaiO family outer membrane beta-barrel protein [Flavobacterium amniphilum]
MYISKLKNTTIKISLFLILFAGNCIAQEAPDTIFSKAKTMAAQNDYNASLALIKQLTSQYPDNLDYKLYLAQLYFWSQDYNASKTLLEPIVREKPNHKEATNLLIKTEFAIGNYETVIHKSKEAKNRFADNSGYYDLQEATALEKQGNEQKALAVLAAIPVNSEFKSEVNYLETQILKKKKNTLAIGHLFTDFENSPSSMNITNIEYGRKIGKNTFIGRINYGSTKSNHELQTEIDVYLKIKPKSYIYLNSGFAGNNGIFPQYKFATEYFQDFNKISASLGARYLIFDKDNSTLLFTGHLGANLKNWKIEYRHYLAETNKDWLSSSILNFRRNFEATESYVQLDLQYGSLPYFFLNNESFERLSAYRIGINGKIRLQKNYFIQPVLMYEREEFIPDEFRNRYSVQLILSTRF